MSSPDIEKKPPHFMRLLVAIVQLHQNGYTPAEIAEKQALLQQDLEKLEAAVNKPLPRIRYPPFRHQKY